LQQFYIAIDEASDESYKLFPGERYCTSLKCTRCHRRVTSTSVGIVGTLLEAPSSMLRHFHILRTHLEENDESSPPFESLPLMFSSLEAFKSSKESFEQSMEKTDPDLLQSVFCTHRRDGEFKFCEAV
jgi:hypothetical protein